LSNDEQSDRIYRDETALSIISFRSIDNPMVGRRFAEREREKERERRGEKGKQEKKLLRNGARV